MLLLLRMLFVTIHLRKKSTSATNIWHRHDKFQQKNKNNYRIVWFHLMHTRYVCFFFIHLNKIPYSYIVKCESLISCNNLKTHEDVTSLNDILGKWVILSIHLVVKFIFGLLLYTNRISKSHSRLIYIHVHFMTKQSSIHYYEKKSWWSKVWKDLQGQAVLVNGVLGFMYLWLLH